jgi:hypothetical protein
MGTKVSCIRPRPSPIDSFVEQNDDDESTRSSGFGKTVTTVVPHNKLPGDLKFNLPLQGETAIALSGPAQPAACALDWRSLEKTKAGEGFFLPVRGIDLLSPLGLCVPGLIEQACSGQKKKSTAMEWGKDRLVIWVHSELTKGDWEAIEQKTVEPISLLRETGLADDQIAKALKSGPFRNAVMAGHVEFRGTELVCTLEPPQLVECVQSCVTQLVDSGLYHLAALMLHQNWDAVSSSDLPWQGLGQAEQVLRDRLDDVHNWGDDDEPHDLAFHRLKSLLCTLLCATEAFDPVQAGHIVMADLLGRTDGKIRNYQEMVMSTLLDLVHSAEEGQRLKNSLIGNVDKPPKRVRAWLQPLDNMIATLAEEE